MHYDGFVILFTPALGLLPILRGGKWNWNPVEQFAGQHSWTPALNALFWFGWFGTLIAGILRLCGL
jgi:hypothetical protein